MRGRVNCCRVSIQTKRFEIKPVITLAFVLAAVTILRAQTPTAVPVLTWRYDNTHSGANTQETVLTPANVNANSFGKLFSLSVGGQVFAQPLYVPGLKMSDGQTHNVLFVATENDSVYAFDADSNSGADAQPLWHDDFLTSAFGAGAGATPIPSEDTGSPDIAPNIGITGTPVINLSTDTMYVVAATKENGVYYSRLHAINIITGAEQPGSPVKITATVPGTGPGSSNGEVTFSPLWENQRSALNYYNGYVYIGYGAHGDLGDYFGWLFAYNASTLTQTAVMNFGPDSNKGEGGGLWAAGAGYPIDSDAPGGRMFIVTGNGDLNSYPPFTSTTDLGESVIDISLANGKLTPTDAFTPCDYQTLNDHDYDMGSGGLLMLPDQEGAYPHILIAGGKQGRIIVLNRDKLGGFPASQCDTTPPGTDSTALQELTGITPEGEGFWNTTAYWNGNVYVWAEKGSPMLFQISDGVLNTTPSSESSGVTSAFPSPSFSISSNGTQDGIAWAVRTDQFNTDGPAVLYAWNANDLTTPIYESDTNSQRDSAGPANKFSIPVVTDGKVYVAANGEIDVYSLLNGAAQAAAPTITPDGGTFSASQVVSLSTATGSASIYYTLDGSTPTTASTSYTAPITIKTDTTLNAIAAAPSYIQSTVSSATFTFTYQTPSLSFSPAAGTYLTPQTVTISEPDANAKIYYTTDGSTPSASSTLYTGPISVQSSETINAIAIDLNLQNSNVGTAVYAIQSGGNTIDFSDGFSSTQGLTLNGSAVATNDTRLQLTDDSTWEAGSVFWNAPINIQAFTTTFEFQLSEAQANGFTFTIQNDGAGPRALGGDSAGLGYQNIQQSVAVKFNFYNSDNEGSDSTGLYTDGQPPLTPTIDISPSGIQLNSDDSIQAKITYDGATLTLNLVDLVTQDTFTQSWPIDIPMTVGGDTAYVGFTGGTGGLASNQKILTWTYTATPGNSSGSGLPFVLSATPVQNISVGSSATSQITITPNNGFTGDVILTCAVTGTPAGKVTPPTCSVTQPHPITGTASGSATLTISTTAQSNSSTVYNPLSRLVKIGGGGSALAALLLFCAPPRRRKWQAFFGLAVLAVLAFGFSGCGGGYRVTTASATSGSATTLGNYIITVTGNDGSTKSATTVAFTIQ
jgi:hypothetical protein